jgi:hypothetical protein
MTNFDRIRAMTAEELAEFLDRVTESCTGYSRCGDCPLNECKCCDQWKIADWLKKECAE